MIFFVCLQTLEMPADVLAVTFRPDGVQLCCACLNGTLQLWGVDGGDLHGIIEGRRDIAGKMDIYGIIWDISYNMKRYGILRMVWNYVGYVVKYGTL